MDGKLRGSDGVLPLAASDTPTSSAAMAFWNERVAQWQNTEGDAAFKERSKMVECIREDAERLNCLLKTEQQQQKEEEDGGEGKPGYVLLREYVCFVRSSEVAWEYGMTNATGLEEKVTAKTKQESEKKKEQGEQKGKKQEPPHAMHSIVLATVLQEMPASSLLRQSAVAFIQGATSEGGNGSSSLVSALAPLLPVEKAAACPPALVKVFHNPTKNMCTFELTKIVQVSPTRLIGRFCSTFWVLFDIDYDQPIRLQPGDEDGCKAFQGFVFDQQRVPYTTWCDKDAVNGKGKGKDGREITVEIIPAAWTVDSVWSEVPSKMKHAFTNANANANVKDNKVKKKENMATTSPVPQNNTEQPPTAANTTASNNDNGNGNGNGSSTGTVGNYVIKLPPGMKAASSGVFNSGKTRLLLGGQMQPAVLVDTTTPQGCILVHKQGDNDMLPCVPRFAGEHTMMPTISFIDDDDDDDDDNGYTSSVVLYIYDTVSGEILQTRPLAKDTSVEMLPFHFSQGLVTSTDGQLGVHVATTATNNKGKETDKDKDKDKETDQEQDKSKSTATDSTMDLHVVRLPSFTTICTIPFVPRGYNNICDIHPDNTHVAVPVHCGFDVYELPSGLRVASERLFAVTECGPHSVYFTRDGRHVAVEAARRSYGYATLALYCFDNVLSRASET